ncbi:Hypothetical predicted protein [Marmota monax]|uniref:Transferrin-like domain-containing protein n=1 Tax=Marmota monax TaxID=9995 RepID=A0A5E4BTN3_MARMO|nr:hypothetical protein GHT09_005507 [Marmota monax]VTJ72973.1 Hypothetical predicted protein [Marmota monax]
MSKAFQEAGIQPSLLCIQGISADHCVQLITAQEADAITLDGGAIYEAGKEYGLKPVVGEVYDQGTGQSGRESKAPTQKSTHKSGLPDPAASELAIRPVHKAVMGPRLIDPLASP